MANFELTAYECMWFVTDSLMDALYLAIVQILLMEFWNHIAEYRHHTLSNGRLSISLLLLLQSLGHVAYLP